MYGPVPWPRLTASGLVGASWSFLKGHTGPVATAAAFPLTLSFLIGLAALIAVDAGAPPAYVGTAQSLLSILPWTIFGVAWHRLILSREKPRVTTAWSRCHTRFAIFLLAWRLPSLYVPVPDADSAFFGLFVLVFFTSAIALAYVQARFSLFLPAAAVAEPMSPRGAWSLSRGYGGLLFWSAFLSGILGILLCIPLHAISFFIRKSPSNVAALAAVPVDCAIQLVFEALAVGALSLAYKAIRERSGADSASPVAP